MIYLYYSIAILIKLRRNDMDRPTIQPNHIRPPSTLVSTDSIKNQPIINKKTLAIAIPVILVVLAGIALATTAIVILGFVKK